MLTKNTKNILLPTLEASFLPWPSFAFGGRERALRSRELLRGRARRHLQTSNVTVLSEQSNNDRKSLIINISIVVERIATRQCTATPVLFVILPCNYNKPSDTNTKANTHLQKQTHTCQYKYTPAASPCGLLGWFSHPLPLRRLKSRLYGSNFDPAVKSEQT